MTVEVTRQRRHHSSTMETCQQLVAPIGVLNRRPQGSRPAAWTLRHVCEVCGVEEFEENSDFDLSHCLQLGGWVCRGCHICRDPACDPTHI